MDGLGEQIVVGVRLLGGVDRVKDWQLGGGGRHGHWLPAIWKKRNRGIVINISASLGLKISSLKNISTNILAHPE